MPSNKSFGISMGAVLLLIGLYPLIVDQNPNIWCLGIATYLFVVSFLYPQLHRPLNIIWFKIGAFMHANISPIMLGLIYFLVFTPTGIYLKMVNKKCSRFGFDRTKKTYWVDCRENKITSESFKNQF